MTVSDLIDVVSPEHRQFMLEYLDFCPANEALRNPLNRNPIKYYSEKREPADYLTGTEPIEGEFLVYTCGGHDCLEYVEQVDSLDDAARLLACPGGYCNPFTTDMVVFERGRPRPFVIYIELKNGDTLDFVKGTNEQEFDNAVRLVRFL